MKKKIRNQLGCSNIEERNFLLHQDKYNWGLPFQRSSHQNHARLSVLTERFNRFEPAETLFKFERRITALSWHSKLPYVLAAACKGGAVTVSKGYANEYGEYVFATDLLTTGTGAGGAVFSMKFDKSSNEILYTASLTGTVERVDIANSYQQTLEYYKTKDYSHWFTGMDVNFTHNSIAACDNKGYCRIFDVRSGTIISTSRLHKGKIHHCEFNTVNTNILATGALGQPSVSLWDLRKLKTGKDGVEALTTMCDLKGTNVATFNSDGSRLLANDQCDQIIVYQGPLWNEMLRFEHPHRQFQHLTAFEASWHPFLDVIVIGKYPKTDSETRPPRPVELYDGVSGRLIHQLCHPSNMLVSLNAFNPRGDILASGMGAHLVVWQASKHLEKISEKSTGKPTSVNISDNMRKALRGVRRDNDGSDSDEDFIDKIKKSRKTKTAQTKTTKKGGGTSSKTLTSKTEVQTQSQQKQKNKNPVATAAKSVKRTNTRENHESDEENTGKRKRRNTKK